MFMKIGKEVLKQKMSLKLENENVIFVDEVNHKYLLSKGQENKISKKSEIQTWAS